MTRLAFNPFKRLLLVATTLAMTSITARADEVPAVLDTFDDAKASSLGYDRILVSDTTSGGNSQVTQSVADGVLSAKGEIVPPRGQPGWVSLVLLLAEDGSPADLSKYQGIRLRIRVKQGLLSVSANSSEVDNYDYHSALVPQKPGDDLQEVRIAFKNMKRAWSQQTPLNTATISSISLVSVNMQKSPFSFEIDEVGFY